jgi:hypothetical protein
MEKIVQDNTKTDIQEKIGVVVLVNSGEGGKAKESVILPHENSINCIGDSVDVIEIINRLKLILKDTLSEDQNGKKHI